MKPITLFDFQLSFKANIRKAFGKGARRVIAQASTGFGKTVCMADIAADAIKSGKVVCIACHREEIFNQLYSALRAFGIMPAPISAGVHPMRGSQCYLGMVNTMKRRLDKGLIDNLGITFFIADEVHRGEFHNLIKTLNIHVLGFTATPKSTGKPELKEYFDDIVCGIPLTELIRIGRLVPAITYSVKHDFSHIKKKGNDFDDKELAREFKKPILRDGAFKYYMRHAKGLQALAYCVDVASSNELTLQFRDAGVKAAHIDGTTPKDDRRMIWSMYKNKELDIICNVGIATTGTDLPQTKCIIKNYASMSLVKDVQVGGRGGRCAEGKDNFICIDMGCNYLRHGEFGQNIDWEFIFQNPPSAITKESKRKSRACDECGAVMKIHVPTCPYCGHRLSNSEMEAVMLVGATIEEIKSYRMQNMPPHLRKPVMTMNDEELRAYGMHMGYSPKWHHTYRNKRNKYKK